eukprot:1153979-Pelagomonas_calceolata.AAC.1
MIPIQARRNSSRPDAILVTPQPTDLSRLLTHSSLTPNPETSYVQVEKSTSTFAGIDLNVTVKNAGCFHLMEKCFAQEMSFKITFTSRINSPKKQHVTGQESTVFFKSKEGLVQKFIKV